MSSKIRISDEMTELINDFQAKLNSYGLRVTRTKASAILAWFASRSFNNGDNEIKIKILKPSGYRELKKSVISKQRKS